MSKTTQMIKSYVPKNEQEEKDKQYFIDCESKEQILTRDNERSHLTSSSFIINKERTKVLCIYHNLYNSWTFVGGHADGDDDMLYVAKKETEEETSLKKFKVIYDKPISLESIPIAGHVKRGKYVPAHVHLNVTYLFEADEKENIHIKADENSNIAWLTFDELLRKSTEPHMIPIFKKIINYVMELKKEEQSKKI